MARNTKTHVMQQRLSELQDELTRTWTDPSIPHGWNYLDSTQPIEPHKTKITLQIDSDMLRWFKKLGPGYQARINRVLRVYYTALHAGKIKTHYLDDNHRDREMNYMEAEADRMRLSHPEGESFLAGSGARRYFKK